MPLLYDILKTDNPDFTMTTTERLLLVADMIEAFPEKWDQCYFTEMGTTGYEYEVEETPGMTECGTACCIAGWAVRFSTPGNISDSEDWEEAGARLLGFDDHLSMLVFYDLNRCYVSPAFLRGLAEIPEPRSVDAAIEADLLPRHISGVR